MFLQLEDISFSYPDSGCVLFSHVSLSFSEGWTVIAGANGAGKSTLMAIAAGSIIPDSGRVRRSGEAILCQQVFRGLEPEDWSDIYSGDNHVGRLKSTLAITDEMIERGHGLSGGEKKRLQLLAALSHSPGILILDEPTNHLDSYSRQLMIETLREFSGIGIVISHDRAFASALSSRTILLQRGSDEPVSIVDIPLPLPEAIEESERRSKSGREAYDSLLSEAFSESMIASKLRDRSRNKQKDLSKKGIGSKDHDAKARIDGARLSGKDASLDGAIRNHMSRSKQLESKLESLKKPLMRKEGLSLPRSMRVPDLSFPEMVLCAGAYSLSVPSLTVKAGAHIAITGFNGSGKTLFLSAFYKHAISQGKAHYVLYIPQEYSLEEEEKLLDSFFSLEDSEKGIILSDMFRMGSDPSALFSSSPSLSPGEMKKLALALSRRDGRSVLLMDEPTNHLDIVSVRILEKMFREDGKEMTILLVSHDDAFLASCTDTVWKVERDGDNGKLVLL